ncbi:MAG: acetylornithine/succinylornithine family transaminase, partial [Gemmatimonadales bacterium]
MFDPQQVSPKETDALLGVYRRPDPVFVSGEGCELIDREGRRYLDFTSGIGVSALGHGHPLIRQAATEAIDRGLVHTSNLYRTGPGELLAELLRDRTGMDRVFFCNSGGEAMEAALKFSRKHARMRAGWTLEGGDEPGYRKTGVIAFHGAFHGRLFGSLAATHKAQYRAPFEPVMPGVSFVDASDPAAVDTALDPERIAALVVEPIQGEGGVRPIPDALLRDMRRWTSDRGIALVLDEVQCGVGRTGTFCAHEDSGIRPDILVLAKPLAGGFPMGAVLLSEDVASSLHPGDHGTTFGGGPFTAAVALAVVSEISRPAFLEGVRARGQHLERKLQQLARRHPGLIREVRGRGLMRGIELDREVAPVVARALEKGLLLVGAGPRTVRILPPLVITDEEIVRGLDLMEEAMEEVAGSAGGGVTGSATGQAGS